MVVLWSVVLLFAALEVHAANRPWLARYEPVHELPRGQQTSFGKSLLGPGFDRTTVAVAMESPYEVVWAATLAVTRQFAKEGGRSIESIDENLQRVQIGRIDPDDAFGARSGEWFDEFVTELTEEGPNRTMVSVTRRIVQREYTQGRQWKTLPSNTKYECWLITRISEEAGRLLAEEVPAAASEPASPAEPAVAEAPAASTAPLANEEIVKLLGAGIGEEVIVAKVRSSRCVTDGSVDALIALKEAGATEAVLEAVAGNGCAP
jgi:hypothetical protein